MTFLNPAILFGLIASAIPIIIHIINLKKLKKVEFSSILFIKELQQTKIKKIKLKQWLLLLIRTLIIIFLVLVFARPVAESDFLNFNDKSDPAAIAVILDNSFSMSAVTDDGSYFNITKETLKELINSFNKNDKIILIKASEPENHKQFTKTNPGPLITEVNSTQISSVSRSLFFSLKQAYELLNGETSVNKEIYILTDLQKTAFDIGELNSFFSGSLDKINTYVIPFNTADINNTAVTDLKINNQIFQKNKLINFTAVISSYSASYKNIIVSLFINNERKAQKSASIKSYGTAELSFETTVDKTGLSEAYVEIEVDALLYDNKRYISFYTPELIKTAIVSDLPYDTKFVETAIKGVTESNIRFERISSSLFSSLNADKYDLFIFIGTDKLINYNKVSELIKQKKNFILMPSSVNSAESYKKICAELNIGTIEKEVSLQNEETGTIYFSKIDTGHPLFTDIFIKTENSKIESPVITKYFKVNTQGKGKQIIRLNDNTPFLSEYKIEKSTVLLFSSAPVLEWSTFPLKAIFAPLIIKSVLYLANTENNFTNINAGSGYELNTEKLSSPQIKVIHPLNYEEIINAGSGKRYYSFTNTNETGSYKFYNGSTLLDYIAVNTNPLESDTKYLSVSETEKLFEQNGLNIKLLPLDKGSDIKKQINEARYGAELWKLFLILTLFLVLIEMFLSKSSKFDVVELPD